MRLATLTRSPTKNLGEDMTLAIDCPRGGVARVPAMKEEAMLGEDATLDG